MTCCDYGKCTNAPNCPVRQAHREAANRAYIERGRVVDINPYDDTIGTFKALISVLVVCVAVTLIFFFWGK